MLKIPQRFDCFRYSDTFQPSDVPPTVTTAPLVVDGGVRRADPARLRMPQPALQLSLSLCQEMRACEGAPCFQFVTLRRHEIYLQRTNYRYTVDLLSNATNSSPWKKARQFRASNIVRGGPVRFRIPTAPMPRT